MTKRYRINSRIRFTIFVALTIILVTMVANFVLGINVADSSTIQNYAEIEVASGDTLWSIAGEYMQDNKDIRKAVYDLGKLNDISAAELQAGMKILVPISNNI